MREAIKKWTASIEVAGRTGTFISGGLSSTSDMLVTAKSALKAVDSAATTQQRDHFTETRVLAVDDAENLLGVVVVIGQDDVGFVISEYSILHDNGKFCSPPS